MTAPNTKDWLIRPVRPADAGAIAGMYNHYIEHTTITFEETPVTPEDMADRIRDITATYPWLVLEEGSTALGYAYIHAWQARCSYRASAEVSVYVQNGRLGGGMGSALMGALIQAVKSGEQGGCRIPIHALVAGITQPNPRSVSLHEKFGFKKIAHFREIGYKFNTWLDVGYWELILEGAQA
ncbi:MAG: GNAT family N-acetyltransferase [Spirochaetaceae bacterium]|nr:GNAT family N-acetyltransferase [Spirochaetaceae bacterium]